MDLLNKDPVIYIAMMYFSGVVRHSLHILVIFEIQACTSSSVFIWLNKSGVFRGVGVGFGVLVFWFVFI